MFTVKTYQHAQTLEEAYEMLHKNKTNTVIGGACWLKMGRKRIWTAIDLERLGLDYITETGDAVHIGASATLRQLETCPALQTLFGGVLPECVRPIVGVQFRNLATAGGSVFMRAGFSDLLTALLALDCSVELYRGGILPLADFMKLGPTRDILKEVVVKKDGRDAACRSVRLSATDFPVLAVAVSRLGDDWAVSVGARPARAERARRAEELLAQGDLEGAGRAASEELKYGGNMRGSEKYRRAVARVLVRRAAEALLERGEGVAK